jgi:solute carrier family 25 protein 34/35
MSYQLVMNGTRLGLHGPVKNLFGASDSQASLFTLRSMAAGVVTGGIGALLGSPFQLLKTRMQTKGTAATAVGQQHSVPGVWQGLKQLSAGGVKGLAEGASAGIVRVMVGSAVQLGTYDTVKHSITSQLALPPGLLVYIASSAVSGACVTACMAPFDLVSTRIYNAPPGRYSGILDAAAKTVKAEALTPPHTPSHPFVSGEGGGRARPVQGRVGAVRHVLPSLSFCNTLCMYLRLAPHSVITLVTFEFLKGAVHGT